MSTVDQTADHQLTSATQAGFIIDEVIADHGVSGVSTKLSERKEGRRLFDKLRRGDTLVVRWVDRLGRNYRDVTDTIRTFMDMGVVVKTVINGMVFDGATKDPIQKAVRDALIAFMAATAESQAEATKISQRAGIDAAKTNKQKYRGRKPSYSRADYEQVVLLIKNGLGDSAIAKSVGISRQSVIRIRKGPVDADSGLLRWGL